MVSGIGLALVAAVSVYSWQSGMLTPDPDPEQSVDEAIAAAGFDKNDKAAIEAIIRAYILENPEIIPEAVDLLRARQAAKRIDAVRTQIETPYAGNSFAGNPDGDVVLVEFTDYACGFCRKSLPDVDKLLAEDPNLKIVFRELPILSDDSATAAGWALAAARQGKYYEFHQAMFETGRPTAANIETAAKKAGLDLASARQFAESEAVRTEVNQNITVAQQLEFTGTPSWVVGDRVMIGAVGYDELKQAVEDARAGD